MAYALKYTSGTINRGGSSYTLNIYQRDYSGSSLEMGDLQGIRLELQGASEAIDAPIIKTSLTFTLADSRDKGTMNGVKYGNWEEFYTPDATLYKVELLRGSSAMWTGFITPDSWQDALLYRGSVSIVCRDNIGHMEDFEFSAADITAALGSGHTAGGLSSIEDLVRAGLLTAGVAMAITTNYDEYATHIEADGYAINEWTVDLSAFEDKSWYEALESVLAAAGLQLRYVDSNTIQLLPIRHIHTMGYRPGDEQPEFEACFVGRSGSRYLEPAYKQIQETLRYDPCEAKIFQWGIVAESASSMVADGFTSYAGSYHIPAIILDSTSEWSQADSTKEVFRPSKKSILDYGDISGEENKHLMLASVTGLTPTSASDYDFVDANNYAQTFRICAPSTPINITFDLAHTYNDAGDTKVHTRLPAGEYFYAIAWHTPGGSYYHLTKEGTWASGFGTIKQVVPGDPEDGSYAAAGFSHDDMLSISHEVVTPDEPGELMLRFYPFKNYVTVDKAYHCRLGNINIGISDEGIPRTLKVTTNYDLKQNLKLKRDVDFGAVPVRFATAGAIRNGFYLPNLISSSVFNAHWSDEDTLVPLPVLNHLQLLSLHAKSNNVLSGTLIDASQTPLRFDGEWHYANRKFILQGGTLNIVSGMMESAVLREFDTYEEAIGEMSTDYTADISGGDVRMQAMATAIKAASAGSVQGGSPTPTPSSGTVTSVGISVGTGLSVSGGPITTSGTIDISVASNYKIPTTTKCNQWDAAYNAAHTHNNWSVLNGIDSGDVSNWDEAYSWGDHSEEGYVKDVVQSLGYTPANADTAIINDGTSFKVEKIVLVSEYPLPSQMDENVLYIRMPGLDD